MVRVYSEFFPCLTPNEIIDVVEAYQKRLLIIRGEMGKYEVIPSDHAFLNIDLKAQMMSPLTGAKWEEKFGRVSIIATPSEDGSIVEVYTELWKSREEFRNKLNNTKNEIIDLLERLRIWAKQNCHRIERTKLIIVFVREILHIRVEYK